MSFNWSHGERRLAGARRASVAGGTLVFAAGTMLLAACGGSSSHSTTGTQAPSTQAPAASPTTASGNAAAASATGPTVVLVSNSKFGQILADAKGMTLYTDTGDTATKSACTGGCLQVWPPLLLPAGRTAPVAGPGLTGLGTFMGPDGVQVTYHGKPLYTFASDTRPGEVTGQGVVDSAGTWHVATVGSASSSTPATPTTTPGSPPTTAAPSSGGASF